MTIATPGLVFSALVWALAASAWEQDLACVDTPARRAFKAQQYELALAELERMVAQSPRDVLAEHPGYAALEYDRWVVGVSLSYAY